MHRHLHRHQNYHRPRCSSSPAPQSVCSVANGAGPSTASIAQQLALAQPLYPCAALIRTRAFSSPSAESNHRQRVQSNSFAGSICCSRKQRAPRTSLVVPAAVRSSALGCTIPHRSRSRARPSCGNFEPEQVCNFQQLRSIVHNLSPTRIAVLSGSSCSLPPPSSAPFLSTSTPRESSCRQLSAWAPKQTLLFY